MVMSSYSPILILSVGESVSVPPPPTAPAAYPRDARTAYLMDPREQLKVLNEIDQRGLQLRVVYHSHPDHDAYFSPTDRRQACAFDPNKPDYPDTAYVVLSIREGHLSRAAAFVWDGAARDFIEAELTLV